MLYLFIGSDIMNDLGSKIKQIRINNNMTQKEFGHLFNVSYQAVSKWEKNLNIPDLGILNDICKKFDLDLNELLNNEIIKEKKNNLKLSFLPIILLIITILIILFYQNNNSNFEFKTISANCNNFNISGSIAYNDSKSSIYISQINYCGQKDENIYQNISCALYEENNDIKAKIATCQRKENITLEKFLQGLTFNVDNYQKTCKNYQANSLQIEITATDEMGNIKTYNIPLKLENNCRLE